MTYGSGAWKRLSARYLPFADAATAELPLSRLLRLSLFQVSVGLTAVLLIGTLNRVMIVELGVAATLVGAMLALPLVFAPLRALIGFKSDNHRSVIGWRRVPYIWLGALVLFGGLAIMPFALILLSGDSNAAPWVGYAAAALAFLMCGAGMHTVQTVGMALATDLATPETQPKVVALLSLMFLVGMVAGSVVFGGILQDFSQVRLIQTIQGAAMVTLALNILALWKQEVRNPLRTSKPQHEAGFLESWRALRAEGGWGRRLAALGLGSAGFAMQDILLEPFGGQVLNLTVGSTTLLTAVFAGGGILGFTLAAQKLEAKGDPHRLAALGALIGIAGFGAVMFSAPLNAVVLLALGTLAIGYGNGLFAVGTLTACMALSPGRQNGLTLGVWGAVQATCAGAAIAAGGLIRDGVAMLATDGALGAALSGPASGYVAVYIVEIVLLFATLAAIGPLVRTSAWTPPTLLGAAAQSRHS